MILSASSHIRITSNIQSRLIGGDEFYTARDFFTPFQFRLRHKIHARGVQFLIYITMRRSGIFSACVFSISRKMEFSRVEELLQARASIYSSAHDESNILLIARHFWCMRELVAVHLSKSHGVCTER